MWQNLAFHCCVINDYKKELMGKIAFFFFLLKLPVSNLHKVKIKVALDFPKQNYFSLSPQFYSKSFM